MDITLPPSSSQFNIVFAISIKFLKLSVHPYISKHDITASSTQWWYLSTEIKNFLKFNVFKKKCKVKITHVKKKERQQQQKKN